MSNIISFPHNSYKYDFSLPEILRRENVGADSGAGNFPEISYYLNDNEINGIFGSEIDSLRLDWLDTAMAVYLADRLSLRDNPRDYRHIWKRRFEIKIAVRNLEVWNDEAIQFELKNLLNFFTDDDWRFEFVPYMAKERIENIQMKLPLQVSKPPRIALFSGGLDSFAGAARELYKDFESPFIFISGATNSRQIGGQRKQIRELINIFPRREILHYTVGFGIHWSKSEHPKEEISQRTRGFMFMTLGAVAALNAGVNSLEIYENGVGAINLPYDSTQVGTMNSRSVSPVALIKMEDFIEKLTGEKFRIKNPCLFQTKGEMCQTDIIKRLRQATKETFSCDGFPVRTAGKPQCGVCTSCLLRRVSFEAAGMIEFDENEHYLTDLTSNSSAPSFNQLNALKAMEWQYQTLKRCLAQKDQWQALVTEFPVLQTIFSELVIYRDFQETELQKNILRLYQRYCDEWQSFSARRNFICLKKRAA